MITITGYNFEGPYRIENQDLIDFACVYVILCPIAVSGRYNIVDVGQTGKVATRLSSHERKDCWTDFCKFSLYVALYRMPTNEFSEENRRAVETKIRNTFDIPCGVK